MATFVCRMMPTNAARFVVMAGCPPKMAVLRFCGFADISTFAMRNCRIQCLSKTARLVTPWYHKITDVCNHGRQLMHTGTVRCASGRANTGVIKTDNILQAWFHEATSYGTVCLHNVPFHVHIEPLNPVDYPDMNKSIVKTYYDSVDGEQVPGHKLSEMVKLCDMKVEAEGQKLEVKCDVPKGVDLPLICVISVPLKFDVEIVNEDSKNGSVTISKMESDNVIVHLAHGDCNLIGLKTASTKVRCEEGSISSSKQLLGAIHLSCGKHGSIKGDRLQGTSVHCATEQGDINVKSVYAEKSEYSSLSGNVHIRDCHGNVTIKSTGGNLSVDSLDGKLQAELGSGCADVFIARQDGVNILAKEGDVTLRFSEDASCSLDLQASTIEQDGSLSTSLDSEGKGYLRSESEHTVRALAPQGSISLKQQDWLSSIKLQFGNSSS